MRVLAFTALPLGFFFWSGGGEGGNCGSFVGLGVWVDRHILVGFFVGGWRWGRGWQCSFLRLGEGSGEFVVQMGNHVCLVGDELSLLVDHGGEGRDLLCDAD